MDQPIPTVEWIHVCDNAFRDESGKMCLVGMFDSLYSQQTPGRLPVFAVAIGITGGQGQYDLGIQVLTPSGKEINMKMPPVELPEPNVKARAAVRINAFPFEEFGVYTFRVLLGEQPVAFPNHTLAHVQVEPPEGSQTGPAGAPSGLGGPGMPPPPDFR
ncbi:MAG: hypothetical protein CMJ94_02050 [Planctomycetes bacterium]|mgnify:CR=1 FL=1|nr:hypothetical protein [Planctomycetota bacterium]